MKLGKQPPEHIELQFVVDGRTISSSTKWWVKEGSILRRNLYCVHNKSLEEPCGKCASTFY